MNELDVAVLVGRLNTGWIVCEREADPAKRTRLENHWLALLRQYESACDQQEGIAA